MDIEEKIKKWENIRRITDRFAALIEDEKQLAKNEKEMNILSPLEILAGMLVALTAYLKAAPQNAPSEFLTLQHYAMDVLVQIAAVKNNPRINSLVVEEVKEQLGLK